MEPSSVRRTDDHAEHLTNRAVMMQRWADLLDGWEKAARVAPESGSHSNP